MLKSAVVLSHPYREMPLALRKQMPERIFVASPFKREKEVFSMRNSLKKVLKGFI